MDENILFSPVHTHLFLLLPAMLSRVTERRLQHKQSRLTLQMCSPNLQIDWFAQESKANTDGAETFLQIIITFFRPQFFCVSITLS